MASGLIGRLQRLQRCSAMGVKPTRRSTRATRRLLLIVIAILVPAGSAAHPHAWIDLRVKLILDDQQRIEGLAQTWVFDPVYTMILMEELDEEHAGAERPQQLAELGERLIGNMAEYDYLTNVEHGDNRIRAAGVEAIEVRLDESEQLEFRFTLALPEGVDTREEPLHYMIYDPVYYIEMLHGSPAAISHNGGSTCSVEITEPDPDPSQIARAAAVDIGAATADGLGKHFAERVSIRCR